MIPRRVFFHSIAGSLLGLLSPNAAKALPAGHANLESGELFLIGDGVRSGAMLPVATRSASHPGRVKVWRPGQRQTIAIPLPFFPHAFATRPSRPQRVFTFEKWGSHMAEIDLVDLTVVRITRAREGTRFFGHGVCSDEYVYVTQMDDVNKRGVICVMDAQSHAVVHEFNSLGTFPHDCQWLPDSNTLMVVNSRGNAYAANKENRSSIVWLDALAGQCTRQVFVDTNEFGYAHLARSADGFVIVAGSYDRKQHDSRPLLSIFAPDSSLGILELSRSLRGEALSIYLDENRSLAAVSFPLSSCIQIWNYRTRELLAQIPLSEPRGVVHSTKLAKAIFSSATTKGFFKLDTEPGATIATSVASGVGGNGSHITRVRL